MIGPMPEETRNKISKALKVYYSTHSHHNKGSKKTDEFKKKVSDGGKRRWKNPEYREHRKSRRGCKLGEEVKERMSVAQKKLAQDPTRRTRILEQAAKARNVFQKRGHTDQARNKISEISKLRWADPTYREKVRLSHLHPQERHRSGVEKTTKALEAKGFKCIRLVRPLPDIIAIKGEMVFAVEYETGLKKVDFQKYESLNHPFNDVIWVIGDQIDLSKLVKVEGK